MNMNDVRKVQTCLSPTEFAALRLLATLEGRSLSNTLRRLLLREVAARPELRIVTDGQQTS